MFGVCEVQHTYSPGTGDHIRASRYWWSGQQWICTPVSKGPFRTRAAAEKFAERRRGSVKCHVFVYRSGDPFGEQPEPKAEGQP